MARGRYHDYVKVICDGKSELFRHDTIHFYLPKLWKQGNANPHIYSNLEPWIEDHYVIPVDRRYFRKALRYVFEYVKELERRETSGRLLDRLEEFWQDPLHGKDKNLLLFKSLSSVFEIFGCHPDLSSPMVSFLTRHISEILRRYPDCWIDYIHALEQINIEPKDMRNVLSYVRKGASITPATLSKCWSRLDENTVHLLSQIIQEKQERRQDVRLQAELNSQRRNQLIVYPNIRGGYIVHDSYPTMWDRHTPLRHHWPQIGWSDDEWGHDGYPDDDEYYPGDPTRIYDDRVARALGRRPNLRHKHEKVWRPRFVYWALTRVGFLDVEAACRRQQGLGIELLGASCLHI